MSVIGSNIIAGSSGQGGGYNLTNSVRLRKSASAYLSRTPSSSGSQQKYTLSFWMKLGSFATGTDSFLWSNGDASGGTSNPSLLWKSFDGSSYLTYDFVGQGVLRTNAILRDPSSWYHIVINMDTTQAISSNRAKIYINGVEQTYSSASYPTQNTNLQINTSSYPQYFAGLNIGGTVQRFFDGYMTEINYVDGQQLTPSSFGETSATTGVWQPKRYSGTYGTNGFYLPFTDNSALTSGSNAGLGKDFSGNGNYWNTNNISLTAGVTYDSMTDVPTLTSATASNFPTFNPLSNSGAVALRNANLNAATGNNNHRTVLVTMPLPSTGKWYWECFCAFSGASGTQTVGIVRDTDTTPQLTYIGGTANGYGYSSNGNKYNNNTGASYGATWTTGDTIGIAVDMDAGTITFYKNNVSQGQAYSGLTGSNYFPVVSVLNISDDWAINFGQRPFAYTPPTGFVALNTFNLPTPSIGATASTQANKYFDVTTYTGNGSARSITNSGSMQPDLVWAKCRSTTYDHGLYDSVRGVQKVLLSDLASAEVTVTDGLSAFNSNGFSFSGGNGTVNVNNETYVAWQWNAGGSTVTNTSGSISSQVRANTSAGFSVVTYTGNGSAGSTIGHGLGVAPKMVIVKCRNATSGWIVGHTSIGFSGNYWLVLNTTNAATNATYNMWNSTNPSSTVVTLGNDNGVNVNGQTYVAYCFAEVAGYSKFTSYVGNGSADGSFIYCGFSPKFVMIKRTDSGNNWFILDSARNTYNLTNAQLLPNSSAAESTGTDCNVDFLSNGFKLRTALDASNGSGGTYIVAAFASSPFKYSLAE